MRPVLAHRDPSDMGVDLDDARDALAYWEKRAQKLPRRAVRKRREALEMARRWRRHVDAAERAQYGRGLTGALSMLVSEGRLPERARHTGRQVARRSRQAALVVAATTLVLAIAVVVAVVQLLF